MLFRWPGGPDPGPSPIHPPCPHRGRQPATAGRQPGAAADARGSSGPVRPPQRGKVVRVVRSIHPNGANNQGPGRECPPWRILGRRFYEIPRGFWPWKRAIPKSFGCGSSRRPKSTENFAQIDSRRSPRRTLHGSAAAATELGDAFLQAQRARPMVHRDPPPVPLQGSQPAITNGRPSAAAHTRGCGGPVRLLQCASWPAPTRQTSGLVVECGHLAASSTSKTPGICTA